MGSYIALFDLDETIINCKSLFEVYKAYCIKEISNGEEYFNDRLKQIQRMQNKGNSRNEINREFYRGFSGFSQEKMIRIARKWLDDNIENKIFFNQHVVNELHHHQEKNATIIIVSGSFRDCVSIFAEHFKVKDFLSINLEQIEGIYTGEIQGIQTIGDGKSEALQLYITQQRLPMKGSYGYGDHMSDLPFLKLVDHPYVVGTNEELIAVAKKNAWSLLEY